MTSRLECAAVGLRRAQGKNGLYLLRDSRVGLLDACCCCCCFAIKCMFDMFPTRSGWIETEPTNKSLWRGMSLWGHSRFQNLSYKDLQGASIKQRLRRDSRLSFFGQPTFLKEQIV